MLGAILLPKKHFTMTGDISDYHNGSRGATSIQWVEATVAAKHPTNTQDRPTTALSRQNVSHAAVAYLQQETVEVQITEGVLMAEQ